MSEVNPYGGPRWLGFVMAAIAAVTLIAAVANTPLTEWSGMNYLFGVVIVVFAVVFAISGARGSLNLLGRWKAKTSLIWSVVGAAAALLVLVGAVAGGQWDLDTILTTGLWAALMVMFVVSISVARKKMQAGL